MTPSELRRLLSKATPGPWEQLGALVIRGLGGIARVENDGTDYSTGEALPSETMYAIELADAALIVAAINNLSALLDVMETAREGLGIIAADDPRGGCDWSEIAIRRRDIARLTLAALARLEGDSDAR